MHNRRSVTRSFEFYPAKGKNPEIKKKLSVKTEIRKYWPDRDQHDYWRTNTVILNLQKRFHRVYLILIWAQLVYLVKLYLLVPYFSKCNHFIIKYDFIQHCRGRFDYVPAGSYCG